MSINNTFVTGKVNKEDRSSGVDGIVQYDLSLSTKVPRGWSPALMAEITVVTLLSHVPLVLR